MNEAGQCTIIVSDFPGMSPSDKLSAASDDQIVQSEHPEPVPAIPDGMAASTSVKFNYHKNKPKDFWEIRPGDRIVIKHHLKHRHAMPHTHNVLGCEGFAALPMHSCRQGVSGM